MPQHHNLDQAANMQGGRGAIKADIGLGVRGFDQIGIEALQVGRLVDKAARF